MGDVGTYIVKGMFRDTKLVALANGLPCQNCGCDDGSVVGAHSNLSEHGKGKGLKAHDCFWAALCHRCHGWLDNQGGFGKDPSGIYEMTTDGKREMFVRAMHRTWLSIWRIGLVKVV